MKNLPNRTRKNRVEVCFDDEELALIKKKMDKANIKNKSDYIRQMCLYGKIFSYDSTNFQKCLTKLQAIGRNLNQMTKIANQTGSIYKQDIEDIKFAFSVYTRLMEGVFKDIKSVKETVKKAAFYTMTEQIEQVARKLRQEHLL